MKKETFAEFLRTQKIITKYKKNCKGDQKNGLPETITDDILNIFANEQGRDSISFAFLWDGTPEGYEFWSAISVKWRHYKP